MANPETPAAVSGSGGSGAGSGNGPSNGPSAGDETASAARRVSPRQTWQRGFVLHRHAYGDSSLLLEVFTAAHGRLPLLAKGARAPRRGGSARAGLLQPLQPLWLTWSGRGEVATLTRVEAAGRPIGLVGPALYCALYVNELLLRLLGRHDPHEALFVFYQQALAGLSHAGLGHVELGHTPSSALAPAGTDPAPGRDQSLGVAEPQLPGPGTGRLDLVLRRFELHLLQELGYQLDLTRETDTGRPIAADRHYCYSPEQGLVRAGAAHDTASIGGDVLQGLAAGGALDPRQARAARDLLRRALAPHLGERPLRSRELFRRQGGRGVPRGPA